jgi:hypothetical protein
MSVWHSLCVAAALIIVPLTASAQAPHVGKPIFCDGTYALCIKALCEPIAEKNGAVKYANCVCEVRQGWSMGPYQCAAREPIVRSGRTYMISTYSNLYNAVEQTMSCSSSTQQWAWCYGAPCVVDRADPTRTTCKCPVYGGPMYTLGGKCGSFYGGCDSLWSGATPKADVAANAIFAAFMKKHGYPHNGPAAMCPTTN